jgi:hypothetical protein
MHQTKWTIGCNLGETQTNRELGSLHYNKSMKVLDINIIEFMFPLSMPDSVHVYEDNKGDKRPTIQVLPTVTDSFLYTRITG